jgi:outer membrane receptor protein involved in Fe transport
MKRLWFAATSCLAISLGISGTALAQAPSEGAQSSSSTQSGPPKDSSASLGEVVVTAQKRSERLASIPSAVSAVTSAQLVRDNTLSQRDLVGLVPGLQVGGGLGSGELVIRGLNTGVDVSPIVGTQIDGAPIGLVSVGGAGGAVLPQIDPSTIARIEVLRGPQGTLYGGSTLGGIVNYVTSSPSLERVGGSADLEGSDTHLGGGNWAARAMIEVPIVQDKLALQVSGFYDGLSGFINAPNATGKNYNLNHDDGGRVALLWQATPDLSIQLSDLYSSMRSYSDEVIAAATSRLIGPGLTYSPPVLPRYDNTFNVALAKVNYDLHWATLAYIGSYQTGDSTYVTNAAPEYSLTQILAGLSAFGGQSTPLGVPISAIDSETFTKTTQEVRLTSPDQGAVRWVAGLFYDHEQSNLNSKVSEFTSSQTAAPGPLGKLLDFGLLTQLQEISGFGDITASVTSKLDLTGGIRYGQVDQQFRQLFSGSDVPAYNTLFGLFGFTPIPANSGLNTSNQSFATYLAGARYRFTPDTMAYFRFSTGFRPGGPNIEAIGLQHTFNADSTDNYEIGLKSYFWDRRAYIELTAFDVEWNDIQVTTVSAGGSSGEINGGHAHSRGVEATISLQPIHGLKISGSGSYDDAKFDQTIITGDGMIALKGDVLPNSPVWSGTVGAEYEWSLRDDWRAFAGGQVRYNGSREAVPQHSAIYPEYLLPAYVIGDIRAGVRNDTVELSVFVRNLGDARAQLDALTLGLPYVVIARPQTVGVSLSAHF